MSDRLPGSSYDNPVVLERGGIRWLIYRRDTDFGHDGFEFSADDCESQEDWRWGRGESVHDCKNQISFLLDQNDAERERSA